MHVTYAAVLLLLLTEGCARVKPDTQVSEPAVVATQPGTPKPAAKPIAPATPQPAPAEAPAPSAKPVAAGAASKAAPPVAKATAVAPALDLTSLEERLRETEAIGFFTKITLKNQVDDLLDRFRDYYEGEAHNDGSPPVLRAVDDEGAIAAAGRGPGSRVRHRVLARGNMGPARGSEEVRDPTDEGALARRRRFRCEAASLDMTRCKS